MKDNVMNEKKIRTHLIRYDKPFPALLNDTVNEVHGMIIAVTCDHSESASGGILTYRIPLVGKLMEPGFPYSERIGIEMRLLPEDKKIKADLFHELINYVDIYGYIMNFLESLAKHHFMADIQTDIVHVKVKAKPKGIRLSCDWFSKDLSTGGEKNFTPMDSLIVFRIMQYLNRPFVFEPEHEEDHADYEKERRAADDLNRLEKAFLTDGFYETEIKRKDGVRVRVYHDGTFLYAPYKTRTRLAMTLDCFLKNHPDVFRTGGKLNVFHDNS